MPASASRHNPFGQHTPIFSRQLSFSPNVLFENGLRDETDRHSGSGLPELWLNDFEFDMPSSHASPGGFSRLHGGPVCVASLHAKNHKRKASSHVVGVEKKNCRNRRKTKWNVEPHLGKMRAALRRVRVDRDTTTEVSRDTGIPTRTLRRYVNLSKDPEDGLFYIDMPADNESQNDSESDVEEPTVVWRPRTSVPISQLCPAPSAVLRPNDEPQEHAPFMDDAPFMDAAAAGDISGLLDAEALFNTDEFDELFADFMSEGVDGSIN